MNKIEESLSISEEILSDLELNRISLEQICLKCLRLSRLTGDNDSIKWFTLEINGYDYNNIIDGIDTNEYFNIAIKHGRGTMYKNPISKEIEKRFLYFSISELESLIKNNSIALENIQTPSSYAPAISSSQVEGFYSNIPLKHEFVQERYQDVVTKVQTEQNTIIGNIKNNQSLLGKIRANIYQYVLEKNYELKYGNSVYNIFDNLHKTTLQKIENINKESLKILSSIYDNLNSTNPVDWTNAVHNCRRVLQDISNILSPYNQDRKEKTVGSSNKIINLGKDNYINRLIDFIETKSESENFINIVGSHLSYIGERLDSIYGASNKGTHKNDIKKEEAERYVIYTFLLLNDLLNL